MSQLQSMDTAERSVEDVRRIQRQLKAETGLQNIASADNQVKGQSLIFIERKTQVHWSRFLKVKKKM